MGARTSLQLCKLPFRPEEGQGQTHLEHWQTLNAKIQTCPTCLGWQLMSLLEFLSATEKQIHLGRLHMGLIQWHLRLPVSLEKVIPIPKVTPPSFKMVAPRRKCSSRPTIKPPQSCSANLFTHIKRRVQCSLSRTHCKGNLVPSRKQVARKLSITKGGSFWS